MGSAEAGGEELGACVRSCWRYGVCCEVLIDCLLLLEWRLVRECDCVCAQLSVMNCAEIIYYSSTPVAQSRSSVARVRLSGVLQFTTWKPIGCSGDGV